MSTGSLAFDAVVVGAGTAGASAAYHLAKAGLAVALVDIRPFGESGARWVNAVPPWMFDRTEIPRPRWPEARITDASAHMFDLRGEKAITISPAPTWNIDMRMLVARIQKLAFTAGVAPYERTRVTTFDFEGPRPVRLHGEIETAEGARPVTFSARLFIDATGLAGLLRKQVDALHRHCPEVPKRHLCTAAQFVHHIADMEGAREFLRRRQAQDRDALPQVGVDGGFSTANLQVDLEHGEVEILTGALADGHHKSGTELVDDVLRREPWIGERVFGGQGLIPLRRPYDLQGTAGIALIGNAGCQVFPAHGSGIGSGIVAGKILAESVTRYPDPGSADAIHGYSAAFMGEIGAVNAAYDVFRMLSQRLDEGHQLALLHSGMMTSTTSEAALAQRMAHIPLNEVPRLVGAFVRHLGLAGSLLPTLIRMQLLYRVYQLYPMNPSGPALRLWSRVAASLMGEPADLVDAR